VHGGGGGGGGSDGACVNGASERVGVTE